MNIYTDTHNAWRRCHLDERRFREVTYLVDIYSYHEIHKFLTESMYIAGLEWQNKMWPVLHIPFRYAA